MRLLIFIALFACSAFSAGGFTYKWIIADGDTVTKTKWKANNDSVKNWADRTSDTLNRKYVRWAPSSLTHDSVLRFLNVDTIRHGVDIDTILGLNRLTGFTKVDSLFGVPAYLKRRFIYDTLAGSELSATHITSDSVKVTGSTNTTGNALVSGKLSSSAYLYNGYDSVFFTFTNHATTLSYGTHYTKSLVKIAYDSTATSLSDTVTLTSTAPAGFELKIIPSNKCPRNFNLTPGIKMLWTSGDTVRNSGLVFGKTSPANKLTFDGKGWCN